MGHLAQEASKAIDVDQLRSILHNHPDDARIVLSGNLATPKVAVDLIDESFQSATINVLNAIRELPVREGISLETSFVGPGMRGKPTLKYAPARLSMVPIMFRHEMKPDIVIVHTSLPAKGKVSLGIEVNVLPAAIDAAKKNGGIVVALANPNMPYTFGASEIDLDDIDYLVEIDEPLLELPTQDLNDAAHEIGSLIAHRIKRGSTLQLGIGSIPDAVLKQIRTDRIRIWTETFSDGVLELDRAGVLDQDKKLNTSFLIGSRELYDWAHRNKRLRMHRTEVTNDPALISRNRRMISINAALQFDLHGQANASRLRGGIYSGFGGSTDFIVGAMHSKGGRSFMALPSWNAKADVSTIVDQLDCPATSFQQNAVVTEQGMAWLFGYDEKTQAQHIITQAAHPDARDHLQAQATKLWP